MGLTDRELEVQGQGASGGTTIALIVRKGRVTTVLAAYQTVVIYTVSAAPATGFVREIGLVTTDPLRTQFQLTIDGIVQFTEEQFLTSWAIPFPENSRLNSDAVVLLEAQSIDETQITVDGVISGHERS